MFSLYRKELTQFFGSLIGYLAIITFLIVSGLFLWVFPGNFNIPESGYSTLEPFFNLAPWLYLFLVPAITMRLFAEERKNGTMELLLTRPVTDFQLVGAKFLAAFTIVVFSLLPTLIYFYSVWQLGNPLGNLDTGSTGGAYFGLFFLGAIYVSIGLFASSVSDNQIVSFILAMSLSFIFFTGFEFIAVSGVPYAVEKVLTWLSINDHYLAVSRGVIDAGDGIYFVGMTFVFLFLTMLMVRKVRISVKQVRKWGLYLPVMLIILFFISGYLRPRLDLTADKRYSLSSAAKVAAGEIPDQVTVELFLTGELQPGFRKLQQAVADKVRDIARYSGRPVRLIVTDPYEAVAPSERNNFFDDLAAKGIRPTDVRYQTGQGTVTRLVFPGALIRMGNQETGVSFLRQAQGFSAEANLNHSVENIEFELIHALRKMMITNKPEVMFLQGYNMLNNWEVYDLAESLREMFTVVFESPQDLFTREEIPRVLVIANPTDSFSEQDKFIIDQAFMKGSRLLWLIDPVQVSLDSLSTGMRTLAFPRDLNLNDILFQYGVRLNTDLIQDVVCSQIMVNTAPAGNPANFTPQPWYYSPLLTPSDQHPIGRNVNFVQSEFVSSLDTVEGAGEIAKTVILSTSPYGRIIRTPASVSLSTIDSPPARELFNIPFIPTGVLLEGRFRSVFRNRMLDNLGMAVEGMLPEIQDTKMMVFSDGNLLANKVRYNPGGEPAILPLGYDRVSRQTFGNKEFFIHAINYLNDDKGIMELRSRTIQLRLLDKVAIREKGRFYAWLNTAFPALLIVLFALIYNVLRNRKYKMKNNLNFTR
jgi:ABC-2 type transport system permease protein